MESYPSPTSPPPPRGNRLLTWIVAGLGALVLVQIAVAAAVVATVPQVRDRVAAVFARPAGPPPPAEPGPAGGAEAPSSPVLIEDDFDQPTNRWDQSFSRIADGALELRIDIPNYDGYALYLGPEESAPPPEATPAPGEQPQATPAPGEQPPPGPALDASTIDDFDLAVDVQQTAGPPTTEYGIRFRQSGPHDYLLFSISGGGYYRLLRVRNERYEPIVPWTFDGRVRTGPGAVNRLRVTAKGADVTGFINGVQVVQVKDEVDVGGQLTLGLQTYDGGAAVRFDNIEGRVGEVELQEDFADPAKARWSSGGAQIVEGAYEIVAGAGIQTWQQPLPTGASRVGDFELQVDATLQSGEGDGVAYGVMFGDGGSFDFYSLFIFPEGGLALLRTTPSGESQVLVPPIPIAAVNPGMGQTNTITIAVSGRVLSVALNGTDLGQLELDEEVRGMVGLIVSSGSASEVRVRFDNFRLEEKQP
ncbi:MAG TPA: hypothetical protein VNL77_12505 [Roseiflexaceae bacterium]|nr:hypothetical protein [Roseiflexaceae bacterium]